LAVELDAHRGSRGRRCARVRTRAARSAGHLRASGRGLDRRPRICAPALSRRRWRLPHRPQRSKQPAPSRPQRRHRAPRLDRRPHQPPPSSRRRSGHGRVCLAPRLNFAMKRLVFTFLLPLGIVAGAVAGAAILVKSADSAEAKPPAAEAPMVEVVQVSAATRAAQIAGNGRVEAARQLTISPQLSGRLTNVAPELVVGARVREGQVLARIDARDYQSAVAREQNTVAAAQRDLEVEKARARASEREWELLGDGKNAEPDAAALVRREPQREAAQANLKAAKSAVSKAKADVSRTVIKAPFDATVLSEQVEEGQFVSIGAQLATLMATEEVWIRIAVPVESLAWI